MPNPNLHIARKKALQSPFIGKRGKGKKTLKREEALEFLEGAVLNVFEPIIQKKIKQTLEGDHRAYQDLMNRVFGKPKERIDVNGARPFSLLETLTELEEEEEMEEKNHNIHHNTHL